MQYFYKLRLFIADKLMFQMLTSFERKFMLTERDIPYMLTIYKLACLEVIILILIGRIWGVYMPLWLFLVNYIIVCAEGIAGEIWLKQNWQRT